MISCNLGQTSRLLSGDASDFALKAAYAAALEGGGRRVLLGGTGQKCASPGLRVARGRRRPEDASTTRPLFVPRRCLAVAEGRADLASAPHLQNPSCQYPRANSPTPPLALLLHSSTGHHELSEQRVGHLRAGGACASRRRRDDRPVRRGHIVQPPPEVKEAEVQPARESTNHRRPARLHARPAASRLAPEQLRRRRRLARFRAAPSRPVRDDARHPGCGSEAGAVGTAGGGGSRQP